MKLKQENLKPKDRFDLEQDIMNVWGLADDLNALFEHFYEHHEEMSVDDMANALLGLHHMTHIKCQKLFNTFSELAKSNKI